MKPILHTLLTCVAALAISCNSTQKIDYKDFTVDVYTPSEASGFDIRGTEKNSSTLITIRNPWQGAKEVEQHLLVLRNDETPPSAFDGQIVETPLRRVVCMSSSHVAMFEAIGLASRISGVSGIDYISNDYVCSHKRCGEVRDVGYDTNIDFELLTAMRPGIVLLYGVTGENTIVTGKLRELSIPYIYIGDYMEESPLGKAEWLVLAAELCDIREQGQRIFHNMRTRYQALRTLVESHSELLRPRVMLNTPYRDTWFMPSSRSYMIRLIEDAGGVYIYTKNDSDTSVAVDLEEAYQLANSADAWLNVGSCNTLAELTEQNPKFAEVPAVRNRMVWNNNRRQTPLGGSDFWESGVVRPDRVLADLITLLHPELAAEAGSIIQADSTEATSSDTTYYYKRLE